MIEHSNGSGRLFRMSASSHIEQRAREYAHDHARVYTFKRIWRHNFTATILYGGEFCSPKKRHNINKDRIVGNMSPKTYSEIILGEFYRHTLRFRCSPVSKALTRDNQGYEYGFD